ncbi:MAG: hypothetical protein V1875_03850 [Candidatus Altiarchaeota archaeon]
MRLSVCFLLALALAGCLGADNASRASCAGSRCDGVPDRDSCLTKLAEDCREPGFCGSIVEREAEYRCRLRFGEYDQLLCAGISNESVRRECYLNGAELTGDARLCGKLGDKPSDEMCLASLARRSGNRTLCAPIRHKDRREFCFAVADGDGTICGNLVGSDLRIMCVEWTMKRLPTV